MDCSEAMDVPYEIVLKANATNIIYLIPKSSKKVNELLYNNWSEWKTERNSGKWWSFVSKLIWKVKTYETTKCCRHEYFVRNCLGKFTKTSFST